jgi:hypothetical protein
MTTALHGAFTPARACAVSCALCLCLPAMTAELTLGPPRDEGGVRIYDIYLTPGPGDNVAGLQTGLTLPAGWAVADAVPGAAAQRANKQVLFSEHGGALTVMVAGFNQSAIGEGPVATLHLEIPAGAPGAPRLVDAVLSGPDGKPVAVTVPAPQESPPGGDKEDAHAPPAGVSTPLDSPVPRPDAATAPGAAPQFGRHADTNNLALLAGLLGLPEGSGTARRMATGSGMHSPVDPTRTGREQRGSWADRLGMAAPAPGMGQSTPADRLPGAGLRGTGREAAGGYSAHTAEAGHSAAPAVPEHLAMTTPPSAGSISAISATLRGGTASGAESPPDGEGGVVRMPGDFSWTLLFLLLALAGLFTLRGRFMRGA